MPSTRSPCQQHASVRMSRNTANVACGACGGRAGKWVSGEVAVHLGPPVLDKVERSWSCWRHPNASGVGVNVACAMGNTRFSVVSHTKAATRAATWSTAPACCPFRVNYNTQLTLLHYSTTRRRRRRRRRQRAKRRTGGQRQRQAARKNREAVHEEVMEDIRRKDGV